jgi:mannitol operon repressor
MRITNNPTPNEQFGAFLDSLHAETDRGSALSAASFSEELLKSILLAFMAEVPATGDLISGFEAPIGTFSAKIKLTFALGLIDLELYRGLDAVRKIRNAFAHQWTPVSFNEQPVPDLINNIPDHPIISSASPLASNRVRFEARVSAMLMELCFLPMVIVQDRRVPSRLIRFGKMHESKEAADAEHEEYRRTGVPPWSENV